MGLMKKYYLIGIAGIIILLGVAILMYTPEGAIDLPQLPGNNNQETSNTTDSPTSQQETGGTGSQTTGQTPSPSPSPSTASLKNQGRVIFTIKDEFVSIDQIDSILFTVNEIQIQSPTKGWITVMTGPRVYDLVKMYKSGTIEFLSEITLDPGTYNQVRMGVGAIRVIKKGETVAQETKLPSGELRIPARVQVAKGENSSVEIDVLSEKSLHTSTDGRYIFMPVVRVETKSNVTSFQIRQNMVTIIGGAGVYDATYGMDENGNVKDGYRLSPTTKLEIVGDKIRIIPN